MNVQLCYQVSHVEHSMLDKVGSSFTCTSESRIQFMSVCVTPPPHAHVVNVDGETTKAIDKGAHPPFPPNSRTHTRFIQGEAHTLSTGL